MSTSDLITQLPTDKIPPTQEEKDMMSWLFTSEPKEQIRETTTKIAIEFKTVLWLGVLFFLLSIPQLNGLLHKFFPFSEQSSLYSTLLKTFLFIVIAWVILNVTYLWKK